MKATITVDDSEIRQAIVDHVDRNLGIRIDPASLVIRVQSKQNYREHTWEEGKLQVTIDRVSCSPT